MPVHEYEYATSHQGPNHIGTCQPSPGYLPSRAFREIGRPCELL